jgi:formamidopyrimidine-DNA glycosylase
VPELPEVETVRAGLAPALSGARVLAIEIFDERSLKRHKAGPSDFVKTLVGARIAAVVRRGKFIWMPLEFDSSSKLAGSGAKLALVGHLGMSGQMLLRKRGDEPDKLTRVIIHCETKRGKLIEFRFIDQRLFGGLQLDELVPTDDGRPGGFSPNTGKGKWWLNLIPSTAAHIARDPLDEHFDAEAVWQRFRKKHSGVKRVLLDQQLMSGIGNIYADESLWQTKLHYDQPADSIKRATFDQLLAAVRSILEKAVAEGGTSFDEQYKNVNGESGYFDVSLNAYGMTDQPCQRCGKGIRRDSWMNRGSHFCPNCQRLRKTA